MNDALEIANLKGRYCATVDLACTSPEEARLTFREIFLPDVVADYGYGPIVGIENTIEFLCMAIVANSEWGVHMLHSPQIYVNGDTATGDWTVAIHSKQRVDGKIQNVVARYADTYCRSEQGWKIKSTGFVYYA